MTAIELAVFISRVESICAEMGAILQRAAFSPNIKDRLDFSCALFDAEGELFAQAAHIPVHLGSMAFAMRDIVGQVVWQPGDMLIVNDPFLGGTHLPDVTLIAPLFVPLVGPISVPLSAPEKPQLGMQSDDTDQQLVCFVVNRAHHANIGAATPGSMPLSSSIEQEGLLIPPTLIVRNGELETVVFEQLFGAQTGRTLGTDTSADIAAQLSANRVGITRLTELIAASTVALFQAGIEAINRYGETIAASILAKIPVGSYAFEDVMDNDGYQAQNIPMKVSITVSKSVGDGQEAQRNEVAEMQVDFSGSAMQVKGNINCPLSVAAAGVFYVFRCLLPARTPNCAGIFKSIKVIAPAGSLLNAQRPAATAAGNVETSMRVVDLVLGALAKAIPAQIPAASQGTMNNVALGARGNQVWDYYETVGGGMGASRISEGLSGVQCHMTNTLNTPIESLESHFPVRVMSYGLRRGSGGEGEFKGGDGIIREFVFLESAELTLLTERRINSPWGLEGGAAGQPGRNLLDGKELPAKCNLSVKAGQVLRIETPGGGGYGRWPENP